MLFLFGIVSSGPLLQFLVAKFSFICLKLFLRIHFYSVYNIETILNEGERGEVDYVPKILKKHKTH